MFGDWGTRDHGESIRIIHRALDAGINFIDTADVYSGGESEIIVGQALAGGRRDEVVLASKVHMPMDEDPNHRGNSRRWIIRERFVCEQPPLLDPYPRHRGRRPAHVLPLRGGRDPLQPARRRLALGLLP